MVGSLPECCARVAREPRIGMSQFRSHIGRIECCCSGAVRSGALRRQRMGLKPERAGSRKNGAVSFNCPYDYGCPSITVNWAFAKYMHEIEIYARNKRVGRPTVGR
jgi:hypothetical protein